MKNLITTIFLIGILAVFLFFIAETEKTKEVLEVYSPTKIGIDIDKNKNISNEEIFCINGIESFSLEPNEEFYQKYSKQYNLSNTDFIGLGYLAQEFATNNLLHKKVSFKITPKVTNECKYADVRINNIDYKSILLNSGFGLSENKIGNNTNFVKKIQQAKKLHLVILNHHSNKYHTLDCKYGKLAHDAIILPEKQLPKTAKPCNFCHKRKLKEKKAFKLKKDYEIFNIPNITPPPLTYTQGDIAIYFTDFTHKLKPDNTCSSTVCKEFVKLVDNSKESIDIAIFGYEDVPKVSNALQNAKNRGVKIRFVYDENYNTDKTYYSANNIIKNIAEVSKSDRCESITNSNYLMHNKFIIFDNKTVYTGSMNFSKNGLSGYDQNDVAVIQSKEIANLYEEEFEQMLEGYFHKTKTRHDISNRFQLGNSIVEVYFSPQDKSSNRIIEIIKDSSKSIYIPAFLITHSGIANELIKAHNRGVDVKIIIDANNIYIKNSKHQILRKSGIPLKVENYAGKLHSKTMIIDGKYIILGSMNFSNSGENKNDENLLIIENGKLAQSYREFFKYLWAMIPNKYLKYNPKPESKESIGSCSDGVDNNFNGKIDKQEEFCK